MVSVAALKSSGLAVGIVVKVCGLRSKSGNHVLWICIMILCPLLKVWLTSGRVNYRRSTFPGTSGSGVCMLLRYFARNGSPLTSCWYPAIAVVGGGTSLMGGV